MLIDRFAPQPQFGERHSIEVDVSADEAYRAIWATDFAMSPVIRTLMFLRTMPSRLLRRDVPLEMSSHLTLQSIIDAGFGRLAETPGQEIVMGLVGRFWRPDFDLQPFQPELFTRDPEHGLLKMAWNFTVEPAGAGGSVRVVTETRVVAADRASQLKFGLYWSLVRPFSGLIRRVMLRAIRRTCQQPPAAT